jgi:hypothetical protein
VAQKRAFSTIEVEIADFDIQAAPPDRALS